MSVSEDLLDLFDMLGEEFKVIIIKILREGNKSATGELIRSIDYALGEDKGKYFIELIAAEHWEYVEFGRLPGTFAPIAPIKKWIEVKGLPHNPYAVRWKIYKEGISPFPFMEAAILDIERKYMSELNTKFRDIYEKEWERRLRSAFSAETKYKRD